MHRVTQLGYIGLGVSDPQRWERFGAEVLGLAPESDPDGVVRFRMDEYCQRIVCHPDGDDDLAYLGWEVADERALEALGAQLADAGVEVRQGTEDEADARRVSRLIRCADANGVTSEIYCGIELGFERPFHSPRAIRGFVTGNQGLGHVVLAVGDLAESVRFYRDLLGLRESDFIRFGKPERPIEMAFLHCNPRHHSLAFMTLDLPRKLQHIMLQVESLDDVGTTYQLCENQEVPIALTLGRHTNDQMVSFYMVSPSGFEIEYGWGARTIDDATWQVQTHRSPSIWGHDRVPRRART